MRKITTTALVLGMVLLTRTPAQTDARVKDGTVGLSVKGKGLRVKAVGGWMDGHGTGVRARLYTVYKGQSSNVTRWKDATPVSAGMPKFSSTDWKLNRSFRDGTWLCIQFTQAPGTPCAKIHR
ncbi:hypothetical protein [Streptomyces viridosporus]|uniref:hypothetical protein n=1 Tax=Streptomyces viridosporus TaxID=67581 RepID=UPI0036F92A38